MADTIGDHRRRYELRRRQQLMQRRGLLRAHTHNAQWLVCHDTADVYSEPQPGDEDFGTEPVVHKQLDWIGTTDAPQAKTLSRPPWTPTRVSFDSVLVLAADPGAARGPTTIPRRRRPTRTDGETRLRAFPVPNYQGVGVLKTSNAEAQLKFNVAVALGYTGQRRLGHAL